MKSNLDKHFKQNNNLEKDGVWFEFGEGVKFLVRRFGGTNIEVKKSMTKYYKPVARLVEKNLLDPDKEKKIITKAFVESCLIGWKGVELDGKPTEYSFDAAVELFTGLPELLDTLVECAQDSENYREYREEVGN